MQECQETNSCWDLVDYYLQPIAGLFQIEGVTEICVNRFNEIFIEHRIDISNVDWYPNQKVRSQQPPANWLACFSGLWPEKQKHVSALIVAVANGCIEAGL